MGLDEQGGGPDRWLGTVRGRIERLTDACVTASGVDGGAVALATLSGGREVVYGSDETIRALEELQLVLGEGPCVEVLTAASPVLVDDLWDQAEGIDGRWPAFLAEAAALPVRGLFAFPVRVGPIALGTFEVYRRRPGGPDAGQLRQMLTTVDGLATALLDVEHGGDGGNGLSAPSARVHQAAGMVMMQLGTSVDEAFVRLRAAAFAEATTLDDVAASVIERRRRFTKEDS